MPHLVTERTNAAHDALLTLWGAAFATADPPVLVKDGQWVSAESAGQYVIVGWAGFVPGYQYPSRSLSEALFGAEHDSDAKPEGLGPSILETAKITCACLARSGEGASATTARHAAYENYKICRQTVAADWTLGGATMKALVGRAQQMHAPLDRRGSLAVLQFHVECTAYSQQ